MDNELMLGGQTRKIVRPTTISVIVLDASSSMKEYGPIPQDGVNEHIANLREEKGEQAYWCSVVTFADEAKVNVPLKPVEAIIPMTNYHADGFTLLWVTVDKVFDQLHQLLDQLPKELREQVGVVVSVFSDGEDNRSPRPIYPEKLQVASQKAQEAGWGLFAYGIGVDGKKLARKMGFPTDEIHAVTMAATREGVSQSMRSTTVHTTAFHKVRKTPSDEHAVS